MREVPTIDDSKEVKSEHLNGVYIEIANLLGVDATTKLYLEFRGQQVTFPVQLFNRKFISNQIIYDYNGHNLKQLATKYGYSEKWIRKIIKESNVKEKGDDKLKIGKPAKIKKF